MKYQQSERVNFWEVSGLYELQLKTNKGSTHCDFRRSLFYSGKAIVRTKVAYMKNSSFGLDHDILNEEGELCAEGRDVAVCYDFNINKTFRIPENLREVMLRY